MMKIVLIILIVVIVVSLIKINRQSIVFKYGTYYTYGEYQSCFTKPDSYIIVHDVIDGFSISEGIAYYEFVGDTVLIYNMSYCESRNLSEKFRLVEVTNSKYVNSQLNWGVILKDSLQRFKKLP